MSIIAAFTVAQAGDKTKFLLTDTTPYDEVEPRDSFVNRQLILFKADGSVFRPAGSSTDTIDFNYADFPEDVIEIAGLDKDYAFSCIMTTSPSSPQAGSEYTATNKFAITGYASAALFDRMKRSSVQPVLEQSNQFVVDTHRLVLETDNARRSAASGDIATAQMCLFRTDKIANAKLPY